MKKSEKDYFLGQSVGLEEAAKFLMNKSQEFYARRNDDTAGLLRLLSEELQKKSDERYEHPDPFAVRGRREK